MSIEAPRVLLIAAPFYKDISDGLVAGASEEIEKRGGTWDLIEVPGALEVPAVIKQAEIANAGYDAYVALGCVIRGETYHFEIVCNDSSRGLMELATRDGLVIGNGILTVENRDQAMVRADKTQKNKGGGAADAALTVLEIRNKLQNKG